MDSFLILLLTLANAFFATSEIALTACKRVRLQIMADAGDNKAKTALKLLENPTQFLSAVQVGITVVGILNAILADAAFNKDVSIFFEKTFTLNQQYASMLATVVVVSFITFISIVFGELVPKRIAQMFPEQVARFVSSPMRMMAIIARPFVLFFEVSTFAVLKILGLDNHHVQTVTEEEISAHIEEGVDAGVIEKSEHEMLRNVFELDDRNLMSIMTPRTDIRWIDAEMTVMAFLKTAAFAHNFYHRSYPVCKGSVDDVIGVLDIARLLYADVKQSDPVKNYVKPVLFIPETLSGMELVERFREESSDMLMIVDEYGVLQGLITPFDLLQAITGELFQERDADPWATKQADGSWLLDGLMPLGELFTRLQTQELSPDQKRRFHTLGGLVVALLGHIPKEGESIRYNEWLFVVKKMDAKRVDVVLGCYQKDE